MNGTADGKDIFQHTFPQDYVEMENSLELAEADDGKESLILRDWVSGE